MLLLEKLFGARRNGIFEEIIGHDHIKKLFQIVLTSNEPTHLLITGPPASAKTMFLLSTRHHLKNTYFIDGGSSTKAGIIAYLIANHPRYVLVDEIYRIARSHETCL